MPPMGFEPTIAAGERPQTYALDCVATETGWIYINLKYTIRLKKTFLILCSARHGNSHLIFCTPLQRKIIIYFSKDKRYSR
jgi:hypothetical protein